MPPAFRFAPSPNGLLHLGHAYSALLNQRMAREWGGRLLLRIEDIDRARCTPALVRAAIEDLDWLGIAFAPDVMRQSERFAVYAATVENLAAVAPVYPCFCSRADVARAVAVRHADDGAAWPCDPEGVPLYPGTCRTMHRDEVAARLALGEAHALRLDMTGAVARLNETLTWRETGAGPAGETGTLPADPAAWGDVVLIRKDIPASYLLAVVADDAAQGVTEIVRGADLFHATSVQRLLQVLLGFPEPTYHHHALIRDDAGLKLAKSRSSAPLRRLKAEGVTPAALRARLGF